MGSYLCSIIHGVCLLYKEKLLVNCRPHALIPGLNKVDYHQSGVTTDIIKLNHTAEVGHRVEVGIRFSPTAD